MKKRFKSNKNQGCLKKIFLFFVVLLISVFGGYKLINSLLKYKISEKLVMNYLLGDSYLNLSEVYELSSPRFLIDYTFGIEKKESVNEEDEPVTDDYLEDPSPNYISEPVVYIYNTHQSEGYQKDYLEPYSIKPTVMLASYMLREQLNNLGIPTMVETDEVKKVLDANGWKYGKSYAVSRIFMENAKNEHPSLEIFIDLHRDSGTYKSTTTKIDNKNYARFLFVVGLEHNNYQVNLNNTLRLNDIIKTINESLTRGIMQKSGDGVNGVYNQDFNENVFLIEVGGQYNNIEDVKNSIEVLATAIYEYYGGLND